MKLSTPLLTAGGVIVLILAFVAAWTTSGSASGAPGLGLAVAAILLTAAAVATLVGWTSRNAALPPAAQKDGLSLAAFSLFAITLGAIFVAIVVAVAEPRYRYYNGRSAEIDQLRFATEGIKDFHEAVTIAAVVLACLAFLFSWILGRVALAGEGEEAVVLTGWSRVRAAIAPFVGALALALFTLVAPAGMAAAGAGESDLGREAGEWGEIMISLTAGLAALALLLGIAALLTRGKPGFLRALYSPLTARLQERHAKGFLIATEVTGALAAVALAVYFMVD